MPYTAASIHGRYVGHGAAHLPYTAASIYGRYVGHGATDERRALVTLLAGMVSASMLNNEGWAVGRGKVFLKAAAQQQAGDNNNSSAPRGHYHNSSVPRGHDHN